MIDPLNPAHADMLFRKLIAVEWPSEYGQLLATPDVPLDIVGATPATDSEGLTDFGTCDRCGPAVKAAVRDAELGLTYCQHCAVHFGIVEP